jgi:C1A family cysteine protease
MKLFLIMMLATAQSFAASMYVHPSMQEAIDFNEGMRMGDTRISPTAKDDSDSIVLDGKRYFTGFKPTSDIYRGARAINFKADPSIELPRTWDMRTFSHSPVRGQLQGSCWAEGNVSAFEMTWNAILGTKLVFSVDDVIHCSGYGTARNGGQLSMEYNTKAGLAFNSDYPYTAKDGRCRSDVTRQNPLKSAPFLRGEDGGFPTERELMVAAYTYGAFEICGSASSLGRGGRQDNPKGGRTDHCYAYVGWLDGAALGWLDATYHIFKNSWGDGDRSNKLANGQSWGDKGYGYYRLAKTPGGELQGSQITEIQVADTGLPIQPVAPEEFELTNPEGDRVLVVVKPGKIKAATLRANLKSLGYI